MAESVSELKKIYEDTLLEQGVEQFEASSELKRDLAVVSDQAGELKSAGFSSTDIERAIAIVDGRPRRRSPFGTTDLDDLLLKSNRPAMLAELFREKGLKGDDLRIFRLAAIYLGLNGEEAARRDLVGTYRASARKSARERSEKLVTIKALVDASSRARRALIGAQLNLENDLEHNEVRAPKDVMRLAASALMEIGKQDGRSWDVKDVAQLLPGSLRPSLTLAVLFDEKVSFALAEERIQLKPELRYRYASTALRVTPNGLAYDLDGSDSQKPAKAIQIDNLASAANIHLDELSAVYAPLDRVRKHAALAAFLRWAGCPSATGDFCRHQDGLAIDFSELGNYELRDRKSTPTPDMDAR
jgi:hypothetical protein